jgi:hypothetical protein
MADIVYSAAYPKSGITYLNYLLFNALFDEPRDPARIDSDYIIDMHEHLARVPSPGMRRQFVKTHFAYSRTLPLYDRADRAIHLVRDPIDVMMSVWDFEHLLGNPALLDAPQAAKDQIFRNYVGNWLASGGTQLSMGGSWRSNTASWIAQRDLPVLVVRYELLRVEPVRQLARICEFLGERIALDRLELAARESSVGAMREQEQHEIDSKKQGAFYRPELEKGYEQGFRFIGRLNTNSYASVLTDEERREADRVFGSVLAHVDQLSR